MYAPQSRSLVSKKVARERERESKFRLLTSKLQNPTSLINSLAYLLPANLSFVRCILPKIILVYVFDKVFTPWVIGKARTQEGYSTFKMKESKYEPLTKIMGINKSCWNNIFVRNMCDYY